MAADSKDPNRGGTPGSYKAWKLSEGFQEVNLHQKLGSSLRCYSIWKGVLARANEGRVLQRKQRKVGAEAEVELAVCA